MKNVECSETPAIVAVTFADHVVYNILECDGEFSKAGETIIYLLQNRKNIFVADFMDSQSYDGIVEITDEEGLYCGKYISFHNSNTCLFRDILRMMTDGSVAENFYIYDFLRDLLLIKTPGIPNPVLIDYNNDLDIDHFKSLIST